jgi:hypothetical protein
MFTPTTASQISRRAYFKVAIYALMSSAAVSMASQAFSDTGSTEAGTLLIGGNN